MFSSSISQRVVLSSELWTPPREPRFIELYKSFPELWRVKNKEYSNPDKKNAALNNLLFKLQEIEPNATISDVKSNIN
ncbi:hypothetical protein NQ318_004793 [Aromia moschata]|uniref:MADF domain-containing protein n=1 Tax=Aromia moschata TaxID=1265417 RepID=A0AAV8XQ25_9CUCU|nr:hypothetical protein NQ318_004793 [Aromia moschata]